MGMQGSLKHVLEGWAVQVRVGLDFKGEPTWVMLTVQDGAPGAWVEVCGTRAEARLVAREQRAWCGAAGRPLKREELRVVKVRQETVVTGAD